MEPAIYEEQVTVPLPTALTHIHFVTACECLLLIFFSATRNSATPAVSYTLYHAILMTPMNM